MAQKSERFGDLELHYSVFNTTFLSPQVASAYNIVRSKDRGVVNLALRRHRAAGTEAVAMQLRGSTADLMQRQQTLEFQEIREGQSIYYVAVFKFINEDWHRFNINFLPEGARRSTSFSFKQQMFQDE